jgi:hypothetical protein
MAKKWNANETTEVASYKVTSTGSTKRYDVTFIDSVKIPELLQEKIGKKQCEKTDFIRINLSKEELIELRNNSKIKIKEVKQNG